MCEWMYPMSGNAPVLSMYTHTHTHTLNVSVALWLSVVCDVVPQPSIGRLCEWNWIWLIVFSSLSRYASGLMPLLLLLLLSSNSENFLFNCILNAPCNFMRVLVFGKHVRHIAFDPFFFSCIKTFKQIMLTPIFSFCVDRFSYSSFSLLCSWYSNFWEEKLQTDSNQFVLKWIFFFLLLSAII